MLHSFCSKGLILICSLLVYNATAQQAFSSGNDVSSPSGSMSFSVGQVFYSYYDSSSGSIQEGVQQHSADICDTVNFGHITSVVKVGNPKAYRAFFSLPSASNYRLQLKSESDTAWKTPLTWSNSGLTQQNFQAVDFAEANTLRIGHFDGTNWYYGCEYNFNADCKPMTANAIELVAPFCAGDSALLKAITTGGYKVKSFLWNTGETTRFIYGQQGLTYSVVVTDESGCTESASVTVSSINTQNTPSNFAVSKPNAVTFTATWSPAVLGSGVNLIGYRMQYRQVGVGAAWTSTSLTTNTTATVNFTGSGLPNANYEFTVFARVNDNGSIYNTQNACLERRFYNGSGNKMDEKDIALIDWTLYPNPTSSYAYLKSNSEGKWRVLSIDGKHLFSGEYTLGTEQQIDLSALSKGVYLFEFENESGLETKRLMRN